MTVESVTYIDDLNASYPNGATDPKSEGDNHIRNIKTAIKATFPSVTGAVTATHTELNILDGVTATASEINQLVGSSAHKTLYIDHGTKSANFALDLADGHIHAVAFSASATLTISSTNTLDRAIVVVKSGGSTITLAGIDNNSPTITATASKQDFLGLVSSFGKISCVASDLNEDTV